MVSGSVCKQLQNVENKATFINDLSAKAEMMWALLSTSAVIDRESENQFQSDFSIDLKTFFNLPQA